MFTLPQSGTKTAHCSRVTPTPSGATKTPCLVLPALERYIRGQMPELDGASAEQHIKQCAACRARRDAMIVTLLGARQGVSAPRTKSGDLSSFLMTQAFFQPSTPGSGPSQDDWDAPADKP